MRWVYKGMISRGVTSSRSGRLVAYRCLPIDITAVYHVEHHDRDDSILNVADEPIVTHPVLPKLAENRSVERPAQAAGILQGRNPLCEKSH